jgi:uncharacterized repeat protein (TIGR04042 family)
VPEMTVTVRWPDGHVEEHYSPSLVVHDHLQPGITYAIEDFAGRAQAALAEAGERVRAKYGFYCTSAAQSAHRIGELAAAYPPGTTVEVLAMQPPLHSDSSAPSAASASTTSVQAREPR